MLFILAIWRASRFPYAILLIMIMTTHICCGQATGGNNGNGTPNNGGTSTSTDGAPFPRIANCYGAGLSPNSTAEDIEEIALFDLLIGGVGCNWNDQAQRDALAQNIAAVRAKNPHIIILDFSTSAPYADPNDTTFPGSGWLLQLAGTRIAGWPGTDMINLTKPEVIDWLATQSLTSLQGRGFDGTFIDGMAGIFDAWACNSGTGEPYDVDADADGQADNIRWLNGEWLEAKTELSRRVRDTIGPDAPFMANGSGEWGMPHMSGILLEESLHGVLAGTGKWDDVYQRYLQWSQVSNGPNVTTIVTGSGLESPFLPWETMGDAAWNSLLEQGRQQLQRMRFSLTTALMGNGYHAYDFSAKARGQHWWYPEYDAPLGYPKGDAQWQPNGTWRREFDGGTAIVNPTALDSQLSFESPRKDISSKKIDVSFVVPPIDGRIYVPTEDPTAPGVVLKPGSNNGGQIPFRLENGTALFDPQGRIDRLTDGTHTILQNLWTFIVSDDRFQDFAYEATEYDILANGDLVFRGRRTNGATSLSYEQDVTADAGALKVSSRWVMETGGHFHMWRQLIGFPGEAYAGGSFIANGTQGELPEAVMTDNWGTIASGFSKIIMSPKEGPSVTVEVSENCLLVDERRYGGSEYRLAYSPVHGDIAAGHTWEYTLRISID